ncbi:MAG: cob(I)yrinic acid a,c-diamide adenosyltransferase [Leptospiraceae bacterium]|nr:cob(I)yrinic acid a,c-diamide adenosyltransferase [Leptospiraceae bacterium]
MSRECYTCFNGSKVGKNSKMIKLLGELDELNSALGYCRSLTKNKDVDETLEKIQERLFIIGSILAGYKIEFGEKDVNFLEDEIKKYEAELEPVKHFIFPTGTQASSFLHVARSVCRRVERVCVEAKQKRFVPFLNKLSTLLFTLSRIENKRAGVKEKEWVYKK